MIKVEIITTGEEVLSGQIVDSNASYISDFFTTRGLLVNHRCTVGDRMEDLVAIFHERARHADVIVVNGGLGPTSDDLSAAAAARALGEELRQEPRWVARLEEWCARLGRDLTESNLKQAMLPASAEMLDNPVGTACGFAIELDGAVLFFTPGVPHELKRMLPEQIWPRVQERHGTDAHFILRRLHSFGLPESWLNQLLSDIPLPDTVRLGFRPHHFIIETKLIGFSEGERDALEADLAAVREAVLARIGEFVVAEEDARFESELQDEMIRRGFKLAAAESCTGGMLSAALIDIPGSSAYFDRGFVTYTNEAKMEQLGVPAALIESHGAVSPEVAEAMALGAISRSNATHALAISGVAGPGGGSDEKPVGTVAFSLAMPEGCITQMLRLPDWGRKRIRLGSMYVALDMLRRHLAGLPVQANYHYIRSR